MEFAQIILTVCALSNPSNCEDKRLSFEWNGTTQQCGLAQTAIAAWIGDHPDWTVKKWTCDYPGKRKQDI